ncbi:hypothetical protein AB4Z10_15665 [Bosea sp. RAF48]|uniref:hypothetical protein n=1 Tax=Bosea sp. RAF48 TaxID=3237480 RepID=UPI003F93187C
MPFEHVTAPMNSAPANDVGGHGITSLDEYEAATERVRELADYPEGTPQAEELAGLVQAIMQWDNAHDDATSWQ